MVTGQRVHRIDDDRAGALRAVELLLAEDRAHDGQEEAERFAGAGARGDDVALADAGDGDGLLLVLVQAQRVAAPAARTRRGAKDVGAARVQAVVGNELLDGGPPLVLGVDLQQRLGPVARRGVDGVDLLSDVVGVDARERRREALVLLDDGVPEREHVQALHAHRPAPLPTPSFCISIPSAARDDASVSGAGGAPEARIESLGPHARRVATAASETGVGGDVRIGLSYNRAQA